MRIPLGPCLCLGSLLATFACGSGGGGEDRAREVAREGAAAPEVVEAFRLPPPADAGSALPAPQPPALTREPTVLDEATSEYSRIRVTQDRRRRALVFVREDGSELLQTAIDVNRADALALPYAQAQATGLLFAPEPLRVLVLGLGGGTLPRFFHRTIGAAEIDAVEIDAAVVQMAAKWFGVEPGPRVRIYTEDAIAYIERNHQKYDLIYVDTFLEPNAEGADNIGIPLALRTRTILEGLRRGLSPAGVVLFNLHFRSGYAEQAAAIAEVFPRRYMVRVADSTQRHIIGLGESVPAVSAEQLAERAAILDEDGRFGVDFAALVGQMSALE